jgi:hypothetical protein
VRFECWIIKATNTDAEYVILIAFPRQKWFRERTKVLGLYAHCLPCFSWFGLCVGKVAHHRPSGSGQFTRNTNKHIYYLGRNFSTRPPKCWPGVLSVRSDVRWIKVTVSILLRVCVCVCARAHAHHDHERYSKKFVRFHCGWIILIYIYWEW